MTKTTEPNGTKNLPQQSSTSISNSNSNSTHSSSCCSSSSPLSSPNIQFQQQQCQKDPYLKNLTMKSQPKRKRNPPFTDCTNTSSPVLFKNLSTNKASNPIFSPSLSTPSPNKFPTPKTVDLEASGNISRAYGRRYSSNKRKDKEKEVGIHTSSVPSKTKDKDVVFPANSEPIKFQQQCQKDPNSFENLTMESERKRKLTHRPPFSDCTNTSSFVPPKPTKYKPFDSFHIFKNLCTKSISTIDHVAINLDDAANPISSPSNFLSTPLPEKSSIPETVDLEASGNISRAYGRRYSSNKRNNKEKEVPTSSVPSKSKDKDEVSLANSEPIKFQQQCQKDPNSFENLTMESERKRKLTRTTPFSDCTNTSSSSSVPPKSTKYEPSYTSPVFKNLSTKSTSTTNAVAVNLDDAANPNSSPSNFLSTPLPEKSSLPEFIDLEDSGMKSIVYSRRYSSNKRKDEEKEMVIPTSSGVPIKRKDKGKDVVNLANSEPIKMKDKGKDTVISASSMFMDTSKEAGNSTSNKRKDIGEEHDIPSSSTPISRVSNTREKTDGFERANPPKAKAFSAPCTKKDRVKSSKNGALIEVYPDLQDYIKEQNVYFKEIDEEMLVEEVD